MFANMGHKLKMQCGVLSVSGIVQPILLDNTETANNYLHILHKFLPFLQEMGINFKEKFFNRKGLAHTHCECSVRFAQCAFWWQSIAWSFSWKVWYEWSWPPHSPDINPCDYFLQAFSRDTVYKNNPRNQRNDSRNADGSNHNISEETLAAAVQNFQLQFVMLTNGTQSVFTGLSISRLLNFNTPNIRILIYRK